MMVVRSRKTDFACSGFWPLKPSSMTFYRMCWGSFDCAEIVMNRGSARAP